VCLDNTTNRAFVAVLDVGRGSCLNIEDAPKGAQPTMSVDEQVECERAVLDSTDFNAALKRHYGEIDVMMVDIWSADNYGIAEESERRLARPCVFSVPIPRITYS
jgi:primary-amine oxidase